MESNKEFTIRTNLEHSIRAGNSVLPQPAGKIVVSFVTSGVLNCETSTLLNVIAILSDELFMAQEKVISLMKK